MAALFGWAPIAYPWEEVEEREAKRWRIARQVGEGRLVREL